MWSFWLIFSSFWLSSHVFAIVRGNGKYPAVYVCACVISRFFGPHHNTCNPGAAGYMSPIPLFSQLAIWKNVNRFINRFFSQLAGFPDAESRTGKTSRGHQSTEEGRLSWMASPKKGAVRVSTGGLGSVIESSLISSTPTSLVSISGVWKLDPLVCSDWLQTRMKVSEMV